MHFLKNNTGNALFLILIAVALFAALSYAITNSSRGGGSANKEQNEIKAAKLVQFFGLVQSEYQKMRIVGGYSPSEIDFGSDVYSRYNPPLPNIWWDNPNCTSNDCRMFKSNGGNIPDTVFSDMVEPHFTTYGSTRAQAGHPYAARANVVGVGTAADDLIFAVNRLTREVCDAINRKLGIPTSVADVNEQLGSIGYKAGGDLGTANYWSFDATAIAEPLGDDATALQGQLSGCMHMIPTSYIYYHVLEAR